MHIRLMNVAQVLTTHAYVQTDLRPHCVEVSEKDGLWLVVMFSLYRGKTVLPPPDEDPVLVGRMILPGAELLDPLDPRQMRASEVHGEVDRNLTDVTSWRLVAPGDPSFLMRIRPHAGESIWLDESFGKTLPADAQKLHESKRAHMASLIAHERFLENQTINDALRAAHESCVGAINKAITDINRRLEHMEY